MSTKLDDLKPDVAAAARSALADLNNKGIPYMVTATLRTATEQVALWCQGRATPNVVNVVRKLAGLPPLADAEDSYTVTNADGVNTPSNHQGGRALDIVPLKGNRPVWPPASDPRWAQIAGVMKSHGFKWGGDWTDFPDRPHYEM